MKKTLLITLDFPPNIGGVAYHLSSLCSHLPAKSIIVLTPPAAQSKEFDHRQKYKIIRKKILTSFPLIWPRWLLFVFKAISVIKKEKIETILVGQILPIGTIAFIVKKLLGIPYIISSYAMDITMLHKMRRRKMLASRILSQAKKIITISLFTKKELIKLGVPRKSIEIISPATDIQNRKSSISSRGVRRRFGLEDKLVLFSLGRLVKRKGHDTVLKSLPKVLESFSNLIYLIGSEGPYFEDLKELVRELKIEENVKFCGLIPEEEIPAFYQAADIFIMISRELENLDTEGFGIVYLEAGIFAKPVIAGQSGGVKDVVRHNYNGLLVNPESPQETSAAIIKLIDNKSLRLELGINGQKMVENNFSWPLRANQLLKLLT